MTAENTPQGADLNEETRNIWDQNAAFNHPHDGSQSRRLFSWINYSEIPPVLVARLRIPN